MVKNLLNTDGSLSEEDECDEFEVSYLSESNEHGFYNLLSNSQDGRTFQSFDRSSTRFSFSKQGEKFCHEFRNLSTDNNAIRKSSFDCSNHFDSLLSNPTSGETSVEQLSADEINQSFPTDLQYPNSDMMQFSQQNELEHRRSGGSLLPSSARRKRNRQEIVRTPTSSSPHTHLQPGSLTGSSNMNLSPQGNSSTASSSPSLLLKGIQNSSKSTHGCISSSISSHSRGESQTHSQIEGIGFDVCSIDLGQWDSLPFSPIQPQSPALSVCSPENGARSSSLLISSVPAFTSFSVPVAIPVAVTGLADSRRSTSHHRRSKRHALMQQDEVAMLEAAH